MADGAATDAHTRFDLAVVVTTHNSMRTIERCLQSVASLSKNIYVVDDGSTDGTIEACRALGARVTHRPWEGFAKQKSFAISLAVSHEWVLLLDSDESLESNLQEGLRRAITEASPTTRGIEINRKLWYAGGWIHHVSFPDWIVRCGRQGALWINERPIHECLQTDGPTIRAQGICRHESWDGFADGLARGAHYAKLGAPLRRATRFPILSAAMSIVAIIFKQGILRRGFLDGTRGVNAIMLQCIGKYADCMAAYERRDF